MTPNRWVRRRTLFAVVTTVTCAAVLAACGGAEDVASKSSPSTAATSQAQPSSPPSTSADPPSGSGSSKSPQRPAGFGPGPPGHGLGRFYHQHIDWTDCGGGDSCADIWVPLNYDAPDGQAITLKAKRQPAADPSHKVGSLFINPGGPGGSGIDYLGYANFDKAITDVYDVIGFDPRGVGRSTPVDCLSDSEMDPYLASDPSPDTPAEVSQMQQEWARFTAGCVARSGPLLQHISTVEAARDMDILRARWATGTELLRRVLRHRARRDLRPAVPQPGRPVRARRRRRSAGDPHKAEIQQAAGFQTALDAYPQDCVDPAAAASWATASTRRATTSPHCSTRSTPSPLPTSSGRQLTAGNRLLRHHGDPLQPQLLDPAHRRACARRSAATAALLLASPTPTPIAQPRRHLSRTTPWRRILP